MLPTHWAALIGNAARRQAFEELLSRPDPPDLRGVMYADARGSHVTQPADLAQRAADAIWRRWVAAWCARFRLEGQGETGSARRVPVLRRWILARDGRL